MSTELKRKLEQHAQAKLKESEANCAAKAQAEEASRLGKEIAELVKAGATTHDPIQDHVLSRGYGPNIEQEKRLRSLEEELSGKTGELVVLIYTERVPMRDAVERREQRAVFGVLRGEKLQYVEATFGHAPALPVQSHATRMYDSSWRLRPGPICEKPGGYGVQFLPLSSAEEGKHLDHSKYQSYVLAGTKAVREFIEHSYRYRVPQHELLGDMPKQDLEDVFKSLGLLELVAD